MTRGHNDSHPICHIMTALSLHHVSILPVIVVSNAESEALQLQCTGSGPIPWREHFFQTFWWTLMPPGLAISLPALIVAAPLTECMMPG
jgi:hypothetical protein